MKVIFWTNKSKLLAWLTRIFTGSYTYHVGFYSPESGYVYDMGLMRRRYKYTPNKKNDLFNCPVPERVLINKILNSTKTYGIIDYLLFLPRWLGFKVKNRKGLICSEMVNNDLRHFGVRTPWKETDAPPSPGEMLDWYKDGVQ